MPPSGIKTENLFAQQQILGVGVGKKLLSFLVPHAQMKVMWRNVRLIAAISVSYPLKK